MLFHGEVATQRLSPAAGATWAERAWGRYWGWDVKEVCAFIIWVIFAGYIHARATRGWRGSRSAWLGLIGFGAVLFNYSVVNIAITGLHSYSGSQSCLSKRLESHRHNSTFGKGNKGLGGTKSSTESWDWRGRVENRPRI